MSNISTSSVNSPQGFQLWGTIAGRTESGQLSTYEVLPPLNYAPLNAAFTGIYQGDYVRLGTSQDANPGSSYLYPANPGEPGVGVFQGCYYKDVLGNPIYSPYLLNNTLTFVANGNSTSIFCLVMDDPNALFNVQASFSGNVVSSTVPLGITQAQIGLNADLGIGGTFTDAVNGIVTLPTGQTYLQNPANGNARASHVSAEYLDISTISGNQTSQFKIKQFTPGVQNGTHAYTTTTGVGYGNGLQGAFNNVLVTLNNSVYKSGISQNYTYTTTVTNITKAQFIAMTNAAGGGLELTPQSSTTTIFIPISVVLTFNIPVTAGGEPFTAGSGILLNYYDGTNNVGVASATASPTLITSITPTATVPGTGSVYIPLLPTPTSPGALITSKHTFLALNTVGASFANAGSDTGNWITASVSYLTIPV
jgi:hypothetical protein